MLNIEKAFINLKKRNKVLFTIIISMAVILFWKGTWVLFDIIFDDFIFKGHLFWSNLTAMIIGISILITAGVALDRLS
jgi:hypothetical protein